MNIEAWKKLRDTLINDESISFNMADWGGLEEKQCFTSACLAGFVCVSEGLNLRDMSCHEISETAKNILDLDRHESHFVFFGDWKPKPGGLLTQTREEALEYVEAVINTENVMTTI